MSLNGLENLQSCICVITLPCFTLPAKVICLKKYGPEVRYHQWFSKMEMVPLWFFRFKVLLANSLGYIPILHPPIRYTKSWWPYLSTGSPATEQGDFHLSFSSWDHAGKATEDAIPSPLPPALSIFTADSQQTPFLSRGCPQAARPCFACRQKDPCRAVLDQHQPAWGL